MHSSLNRKSSQSSKRYTVQPNKNENKSANKPLPQPLVQLFRILLEWKTKEQKEVCNDQEEANVGQPQLKERKLYENQL